MNIYGLFSEHCGDGNRRARRPSCKTTEVCTAHPKTNTSQTISTIEECLTTRFVMRKWRLLRAVGDL